MKKVVACIIMLISLFIYQVESSEAAATWKMSHHRPLTSPIHEDMKKFAKDVAKVTEGRVVIEVFGAEQLGPTDVVMERVGMGAIEMLLGYPTSSFDPRLDIYSLPALASNHSELQKLFSHGSPFMDIIHQTFSELDIYTLMSYCVGYAGLGLKNPVDGMLDPNVKHKNKVRAPTLNSYIYALEAMGYLATPIPMGDLFTALQTGIVDGSYGNAPDVVYLQFRDVIKHYLTVRAQADIFFLVVNKDLFMSLSNKDQEAIKAVAKKHEKERFAIAKQNEEMWLKRLEEKGVKIYDLTDAQRKAFHKVIADYAWPRMRKDVGTKYFDDAIKAREKALKK